MMKIHIFIVWVFSVNFVSSADDTCSADDHNCRQSEAHAGKYAGMNIKVDLLIYRNFRFTEKASWQKYRTAIETAKANYVPCSASDCSCYDRYGSV